MRIQSGGLIRMLGALVVFAAVDGAAGALTINSGDLTHSGGTTTYLYELTFDDMDTPTKFTGDVLSSSNVDVIDELDDANPGTNSRFVRATPNQTTAEFMYRFDFTGTAYRPTALSLRDKVHVFSLSESDPEDVRIVTEWRADGGAWTTLLDVQPGTPGTEVASGSGTHAIDLSAMPDVVDYRVSFAVLGGDGNGSFSANRNQWNRLSSSGDGSYFQAEFTLIPEPGAFALLGMGLLGMGLGRRRA